MVAVSGASTGSNISRLTRAADSLNTYARIHSSTLASNVASAHAALSHSIDLHQQKLIVHGEVAQGLQLVCAQLLGAMSDEGASDEELRQCLFQVRTQFAELRTATAQVSQAYVEVQRDFHSLRALLNA